MSDLTDASPEPASLPKQLRLGQAVTAEDGPFGELADIIIDPQTNEISHLVVEPHHKHLQSRLVPLWLTSIDGDDIHVALDNRHLLELSRCAFSQFITLGDPIDLGDYWETSNLTIHALPYWSTIAPAAWQPLQGDAQFDRVPKGEIEVRRESGVRTEDGHIVGHVEGMVVADNHMTDVVVTSGVPGLRHHVVVPLSAIARIGADEVLLSIDRDAFHDLPGADGLRTPTGDLVESDAGSGRRKITQGATKAASGIREALGRFTNR